MGRSIRNLLTAIGLLLGTGLFLYPTVSDYWNYLHQTKAIAEYTEGVEHMDSVDYEALMEEAKAYNQELTKKADRWNLSEEEEQEYEQVLDPFGTGMMGHIEIPKIQVSLPIYHGTSDGVLQVGVGHLEGSSLPVGGEGTHAVLSGHRGLPSASLFTDLDKLEIGDHFIIQVLKETLTYEVDQIKVVEPEDLTKLTIEEGEDLCSLVTCTPYGINTHRLVVRGHRIPNEEDGEAAAEEIRSERKKPVILIGLALLAVIVFVGILVIRKKRKGVREK
jgi:sortase A